MLAEQTMHDVLHAQLLAAHVGWLTSCGASAGHRSLRALPAYSAAQRLRGTRRLDACLRAAARMYGPGSRLSLRTRLVSFLRRRRKRRTTEKVVLWTVRARKVASAVRLFSKAVRHPLAHRRAEWGVLAAAWMSVQQAYIDWVRPCRIGALIGSAALPLVFDALGLALVLAGDSPAGLRAAAQPAVFAVATLWALLHLRLVDPGTLVHALRIASRSAHCTQDTDPIAALLHDAIAGMPDRAKMLASVLSLCASPCDPLWAAMALGAHLGALLAPGGGPILQHAVRLGIAFQLVHDLTASAASPLVACAAASRIPHAVRLLVGRTIIFLRSSVSLRSGFCGLVDTAALEWLSLQVFGACTSGPLSGLLSQSDKDVLLKHSPAS